MAKTIAMVFGVIYTLVGLLGFVPALIMNGGLLGIAPVNTPHNIVHLIIGISGLVMGRTPDGAGTYCKIFGVVLLLIGVVGFFSPNCFGLMPIGGGDIWIHLISGAVLAYAGFATAPSGSAATTH